MSEDTKKFCVIDRTGDLESFKDTKAEAIEEARRIMSNGSLYAPYTVYQAVARVEKAAPPVTVVDL